MTKRVIALAVLLASLWLSGCTVAGAVGGMAVGATEGAKKDWASLKKTDAWMRKNLW